MKKSLLLTLCILSSCILLIFYYKVNTTTLAVMNKTILSEESNTSAVDIKLNAGQKIIIKSNSDINTGSLRIYMEDSNKNLIQEMASNADIEVTILVSGTYTLNVDYVNFTGNYKITVK